MLLSRPCTRVACYACSIGTHACSGTQAKRTGRAQCKCPAAHAAHLLGQAVHARHGRYQLPSLDARRCLECRSGWGPQQVPVLWPLMAQGPWDGRCFGVAASAHAACSQDSGWSVAVLHPRNSSHEMTYLLSCSRCTGNVQTCMVLCDIVAESTTVFLFPPSSWQQWIGAHFLQAAC